MLEQTHDKNPSDKVGKSGQNAWDWTDGILFINRDRAWLEVQYCAIRATPGRRQ
jgi:hypothetical protein